MKKSLLLLFVCLIWSVTFSQVDYYPRDSTNSISSTYQKIHDGYLYAKPVWEDLPEEVRAYPNLIYAELEGNRNLHLDLFLPKLKKSKRYPALLMIHGGGWMAGSKENLIPMAQQLAKKGYVTVTVEYRLGGEAPYPAAIMDLKKAVRWLRANAEEYAIDTNKIAAYGCSAGGQLATLLGATNGSSIYDDEKVNSAFSADVQAVLNIDGITSFIHPEAEPEWTGRSANAWLGDYSANNKHWKEASPLEYAGGSTPPILFVNSSRPRFHAGRDDFITIISQYGTYYEVHTFDDAPHGFWLFEPWFEPTLKYSVHFLKRVFK